jgi:2-polyprenyl-3-methyl-5-hydroxy-6-metoxy-1,4-benzoquinol methylase
MNPHATEENREKVRRHYGDWAGTYATEDDDGLFSIARNRENKAIREMLSLRGGESVLDAGCGTGVVAADLKKRGHLVWAVDFAPEMVESVQGKVDHAEVADVTTLNLGRKFDRILLIGVLEWVDAALVLERLKQHLEPGGRVVLLAPSRTLTGFIYKFVKGRRGLQAKLYSPSEMVAIAAGAGLKVVEKRTPVFHNFVMALEHA